MNRFFKHLLFSSALSCSLSAAPLAPDAELPHSLNESITLGRFSMDRVAGAREYLTRRMRRIRRTINGTLITGVLAIGGSIGWKLWENHKKKQEEAAHLPEVGELMVTNPDFDQDESISADNPKKISIERAYELLGEPPAEDDDGFDKKITIWRAKKELLDSRQRIHQNKKNNRFKQRKDEREERRGDSLMGRAMSPVKWAFAIGLGGLILTTGQHALRVLSGTLEEALNLWWRGYMYWYNTLEQRVRSTMGELRDGLHQARKIAQSGVDAALLTRQMRHTAPGHTASTHYRADITMMYQISVGMLERLVALMYIIAPQENHTAIYRNVKKLARLINGYTDKQGKHVNGLGDNLEHDLNENTNGTLTHYSNKTIDMYHNVFEFAQIFLTTYRVYLKG